MPNAEQHRPDSDSNQDDAYAFRDSSAAPKFFASRSASNSAAFLSPYLRSGMELLDCGCGPGSITVDLAECVAPGQVVGIDIDTKPLEKARMVATERNVSNIRFETGSIYSLPFPDSSFDAVFSNQVLIHLEDPLSALVEMRRVLRPGGMAGVRIADHDGVLITPPDPLVLQYFHLQDQAVQHSGGNTRLGKTLRSLFNQVGFVNVVASASCDSYGTQEAIRQVSNAAASFILERDWANWETREKISDALKVWGETPDAFLSSCMCEAVGWTQNE